jgi:hypothetical protein
MKSVRNRVKKYSLQSQRKIPFFRTEELLRENGFVLTEKNKNCLYLNGGSESIKHFFVKALIFKILRDRGRQVGTEVEVNGGIVDVLDLENMIAYEVETNLTKEKIIDKIYCLHGLRDVFFIDTKEVSSDLYEAEKYLKEKVV